MISEWVDESCIDKKDASNIQFILNYEIIFDIKFFNFWNFKT
jgi:hypothetical protein